MIITTIFSCNIQFVCYMLCNIQFFMSATFIHLLILIKLIQFLQTDTHVFVICCYITQPPGINKVFLISKMDQKVDQEKNQPASATNPPESHDPQVPVVSSLISCLSRYIRNVSIGEGKVNQGQKVAGLLINKANE